MAPTPKVDSSLEAELDVRVLVWVDSRELERWDRAPEGEGILNYFIDHFCAYVRVRIGGISMNGVGEQ